MKVETTGKTYTSAEGGLKCLQFITGGGGGLIKFPYESFQNLPFS